MLAPTPDDQLCDARGRPYFLWDVDLTLAEFEAKLADPEHRAYWLATLLRQAKPDDVFRFVDLAAIADALPEIAVGLGRQRAFWEWRIAPSRAWGGPLTGGAALAGFHLGHRTTRDLDLFWSDRTALERLPEDLEATLRAAGLQTRRLQSGVTFCRVQVGDGDASFPIDLVVDSPDGQQRAHGMFLGPTQDIRGPAGGRQGESQGRTLGRAGPERAEVT